MQCIPPLKGMEWQLGSAAASVCLIESSPHFLGDMNQQSWGKLAEGA